MLAENVNLKPGCYVDGHWGQFALAHLIEQFSGDDDALALAALKMRQMSRDAKPLGLAVEENLFEELLDIADGIESALNARLGEGFVAHWFDGEFFISPYCGDDPECSDDTCAHWIMG